MRKTKLTCVTAWYGGKARLASKLMPYLPAADVYGEACGGMASILIQRAPSPLEYYNDVDGRLTNFFRVLQSRSRRRALIERLRYTPYSQNEFAAALKTQFDASVSELLRAHAFFVVQSQGFGGKARSVGEWRRSTPGCVRRRSKPREFTTKVERLDLVAERFKLVTIESRDACDVLRYYDGKRSVHFVDPPYSHATRSPGSLAIYQNEPDDAWHSRLVETLLTLRGAAALSGYESPIYRPLIKAGWKLVEIIANTSAPRSGQRARVECLYLNPRAVSKTQLNFNNAA